MDNSSMDDYLNHDADHRILAREMQRCREMLEQERARQAEVARRERGEAGRDPRHRCKLR